MWGVGGRREGGRLVAGVDVILLSWGHATLDRQGH